MCVISALQLPGTRSYERKRCFFWLEGFLGSALGPNFLCPWATTLALHLHCSTAALPTPKKALSHWKQLDLELLDFRNYTGVFFFNPSQPITGPILSQFQRLTNTWISKLCAFQNCRLTDLKTPKLWKDRSVEQRNSTCTSRRNKDLAKSMLGWEYLECTIPGESNLIKTTLFLVNKVR